MNKKLFEIKSIAKAYASIDHAYITSIVITIFTFLLLTFITLMKAGGVSTFDNFYYAHYTLLLITIILTYGIKKRIRLAALSLLLILLIDKILLIVSGLISAYIGLPIFLILAYFILRAIQGMNYLKKEDKEKIASFMSMESSFLTRNKAFVESFLVLFVLMISSVVVENVFRVLESQNALPKGLYTYPLGTILSLLLALVGIYPLLKKHLGTFHLAFLNILFLAIATTLSTLIPQSATVPFQPKDYYVKAYGYLGHVFLFFSLDQVFHSFWYINAYVLLSLNILRVAFKRRLRLRTLGFYITHCSIVFILIAVWYNFFFSYTGIIPLQVGQKSNKVFLFEESKKKLREDSKELDFYIKLKSFDTKKWESAYNIYVKKFENPIPKYISTKTYEDFSKALPRQFQSTFKEQYVKEKKLTLNPSLTLLSAVGLTFLATYRQDQYHYKLKADNQKEAQERILRRIFMLFSYKGKDIMANSIRIGEDKRLYGTNIRYKVLNYFENFRLDYVGIPQEIDASIFNQKVKDNVAKHFKKDVSAAYELTGNKYRLKEFYKKDIRRRELLADAFSDLGKEVLEDQIKVNQSAVSFTLFGSGERQEIWLIEGRSKQSNSILLNERTQVLYYYEYPKKEIEELINKAIKANRTLTIIIGGEKKIYSNIGGKLEESDLKKGEAYSLAEDAYGYIDHILPNYGEYYPYRKKTANIPVHIEEKVYNKELKSKLKGEEERIVKEAYLKFDKVWVLNPKYYSDEGRRQGVEKVLKGVGLEVEPLNPYALIEVIYKDKKGDEQRRIARLTPQGLNVFVVPETRYTLTFGSRRSVETKYWESGLEVLEGEDARNLKVVKESPIRVNEYMYYNGYRFYQTDAKKEDRSYSGIGVSIEPGLMYIYGGYISLSIGIFMMFYLPMSKRRSKKE